MKMQKLHTLVQEFRAITESTAPEGRADGQLLHDFTSRHDETAFAVLVRRHGPVVLGVCRRILRQVQDAEDAFQATFLVLVRKARALGQRDVLGNWLHGVACHTALKARAAAAARRAREKTAAKGEAKWDETDREGLAILDRELNLLPQRYRAAIVLCDLQGKTQKHAAQQLRCPEGTLASRLVRGRALLAKRVANRGVTLTGTALAVSWPQFAPAAVPSALAAATVRTASAAVPTAVVALANTVVRGLLFAKLKTIGVCLAVLCLAGVTIGFLCATIAGKWVTVEQPLPPPQAAVAARQPIFARAEQPEPGRDRFNDPLPKGALARLGTVAFRHGRAHMWDAALTFSADGKYLISAGGGWLRRWDLATGHASVNLGDGGRSSNDMRGRTAYHFVSADGKFASVIEANVRGTADGRFRGITEYELESGNERTYRIQSTVKDGEFESPHPSILSPDGKTFATVTHTGELALWNAVDGTNGHLLKPLLGVYTYAVFHPDGKSIVVGDDTHNIQVFDLATGNEQRAFGIADGNMIYRMAISPNGKWLATFAGKKALNGVQVSPPDPFLRLWNLETGKEELKIEMPPKEGAVESMVFAPDSRTLIASRFNMRGGFGLNNIKIAAIRTWDIPSGKAGWALDNEPTVGFTLGISHDGKMLATMNENGVVRLWDMQTGKERQVLEASPSPSGVDAVCFRPDGKNIVTVGQDFAIREWEAATGRLLGPARTVCTGYFPRLWAGGYILEATHVQGSTPSAQLFDLATGKLLLEEQGSFRVALSQDFTRIAAYSFKHKNISIIDVDAKKVIQTLPLAEAAGKPGELYGLLPKLFPPDGKTLSVIRNTESARWRADAVSVSDLETGQQKSAWNVFEKAQLEKHSIGTYAGYVMMTAFSPDAGKVAFVVTKQKTRDNKGHNTLWPFLWVGVFETMSGKLLHEADLDEYVDYETSAIAFSPNGKLLAVGGRWTVNVWEIGNPKALWEFEGHRGRINTLAFSPDGRRLASASEDSTVLVWDLGKQPTRR